MAISAVGRIRLKTQDSNYDDVIEYPAYTKVNFLDSENTVNSDVFRSGFNQMLSTLSGLDLQSIRINYEYNIV